MSQETQINKEGDILVLGKLIYQSKVSKKNIITSFLNFETQISFLNLNRTTIKPEDIRGNKELVDSFIETAKCVFGIIKICNVVLNKTVGKRLSTTKLLMRMNNTIKGLNNDPHYIKFNTGSLTDRKIKLKVSKIHTLRGLENLLFTETMKLYTSNVLAEVKQTPTTDEIKYMLLRCNLLLSIITTIWCEVFSKDNKIESLLTLCSVKK